MHRNASPHSILPLEYLGKDFPAATWELMPLAVHSEQVECNEHTKRWPASAILLMQRQHRWPVVTMTKSDLAYRNLSAPL